MTRMVYGVEMYPMSIENLSKADVTGDRIQSA